MKVIAGIAGENSSRIIRSFLQTTRAVTEVMAVAVVPKPSRLTSLLDGPRRGRNRQLRELRELERQSATELLDSFSSKLQRPGLTVETVVLYGEPAEELVKLAKRRRSDLLLLSRYENTDRSNNRLGQVSGRATRYAPCSVVLLHPARTAHRSFLLATDGSRQAERAGERLRQLDLGGKPSLLVCTVAAEVSPTFLKSGSLSISAFTRIKSQLEEQEKVAAQEILRQAAAGFRDTPFQVREIAIIGDTAEVLLRVVPERKVDLLALGAKGISTHAQLLLGSVTLKLLNRATCSILIAR